MSESPVLQVIKPGSVVRLGTIHALVTSVSISANNKVIYQVVWWDGADRKEVWVEAVEVKPDGESGMLPIGFVR